MQRNWVSVSFVAIGVGYLAYSLNSVGKTNNSGITRELFLNSSQGKEYLVTKVSDGDTLTLSNGDRIRLCGIDAPEKAQPLGIQAKNKLRSLVDAAGGKVIVNEVERDRYGRIVAEVFTKIPSAPGGETFIQEEMLKSGMAYHYERYSNNCPNKSAIVNAESIAKENQAGVWSGTHTPPWVWRQQQRGN